MKQRNRAGLAMMWRAILLTLTVLAGWLPSAWAMEHYTNRLTDSKGNSVKGALVYVYQAGTTTLATIYADNGIITKPNPITTSTAVETAGAFDFYAANGAYDLVFSKADYAFDALLTRRITLYDPTTGDDGICINVQTGTTYTVVAGNRGCLVSFENDETVTVTIPQAGTVGFESGFYFYALNKGVGNVVLVPVISTIQGEGDLTLSTGTSAQIISDGINYLHISGVASGSPAGWPSDLATAASTSEAAGQFLSIRGQGAQANNGADLFQSSTGRFEFVCVVAGVRNACDYIRQLAAGKKFEIHNSSGLPIATLTESTGEWTNVKLNSNATGNVITLPFRWDFDLCSISPADSALAHIWNKDPLSTAPTLTAKAGTNRSTCVATFPDSDGDYGVAITRRLPLGYVPGSTTVDIWFDTTGTGNVVWQVATKCYADDEADDAAYNTATTVVAAAGTSGRPNQANMGAITDTGCAGTELMRIRFFRNRTHASDTLNAAVNVEKVYIAGMTAE